MWNLTQWWLVVTHLLIKHVFEACDAIVILNRHSTFHLPLNMYSEVGNFMIKHNILNTDCLFFIYWMNDQMDNL